MLKGYGKVGFQLDSRLPLTLPILHRLMQAAPVVTEGREGVKWELGLALFWTGKMGFTHWDWDLATGNGMNSYKMGMGFLFFSGLCSNIVK